MKYYINYRVIQINTNKYKLKIQLSLLTNINKNITYDIQHTAKIFYYCRNDDIYTVLMDYNDN